MLTWPASCSDMSAVNAGCCPVRSLLHVPEAHVRAGQLPCVSQQLCQQQLHCKQSGESIDKLLPSLELRGASNCIESHATSCCTKQALFVKLAALSLCGCLQQASGVECQAQLLPSMCSTQCSVPAGSQRVAQRKTLYSEM